MSDRLVFLDTEGTGLAGGTAGADRIIEIGLVEVIGDQITNNRFSTLIYADQPIHWGAQRVHGIYAKDLIGKPEFREVADEIVRFIDGSDTFAHNAPYDGKMLKTEWRLLGRNPEDAPRLMCTLPIARNVVGGKVGMDALMAHYFPDMPPRGKHSAADDAEILAKIFLRMRADNPKVVADVIRSAKQNPQKPKTQRSKPRMLKERTARDAALPDVLNPGVKQAIAEANAAGTLEAALTLRVGRDYVTRMSPEEVCGRAGRTNVALAQHVGAPGEVLSALRMIVRGLNPDLAVARQVEFGRLREVKQQENTPGFTY